ncbi:MAG: hypothetical protein K2M80_04220 [Muribaculaceae bacterium]|nr:hypothetical protein [Muribaculaceae bacterium]
MEILVPIFICAIVPIAIAAFIFIYSTNRDNQRAKVLIKAIESSNCPDPEKLAEAMRKPTRTTREIRNLRLLRGCIFSFIGLLLCIIGIVGLCTGCDFEADAVALPLLFGAISLAIGFSYLTVYYVTRKQLDN